MTTKIKIVHFSESNDITPKQNSFYGGMLFFKYDDIENEIDRISYEFRRFPTIWMIPKNKIDKFQAVEGGWVEYIVYDDNIKYLERVDC